MPFLWVFLIISELDSHFLDGESAAFQSTKKETGQSVSWFSMKRALLSEEKQHAFKLSTAFPLSIFFVLNERTRELE